MVYLGRTRKIHFVGIGGIGMSGLAEVLLNLGFEVSGSDVRKSDITERLERMGAKIKYEHKKDNIQGADVVVYSSAVNKTNPELVEAAHAIIPAIPRTEMLAELIRMKFAITVAGSHGKTSTTSLISSVLAYGGLDPTVLVGGKLKVYSSNARLGSGRYLVAEADESDGGFVHLPSTIAVITTIDREHLDYYPDLETIKRSFIRYANRVPFYGTVILCVDDQNICSIIPQIRRRKITCSLGQSADISAQIVRKSPNGTDFVVKTLDGKAGRIHLGIPGEHYVRNALAAIAAGLELEIPFEKVKEGLEKFQGVSRRFELKGVFSDVTIVDDYAHHPTEIAATIKAANDNFGKRVVVLFQPHRYTRTQAMAEQFGQCFDGASVVLVTKIYPAGEDPIPGVEAEMIVSEVEKQGKTKVFFASDFQEMVDKAMELIRPGDLVITMGAGDVYKVGEMLSSRLRG